MSLSSTKEVSDRNISIGRRLLIYFAVWLLAVVAFEIFLEPDGGTVTDLTPMEQRIRWPLYSPLMALFGLAQSFTWPKEPGPLAGIGAAACFLVHAIAALSRPRWTIFYAFIALQIVLLAVSVVYFVRFTQLPCCP